MQIATGQPLRENQTGKSPANPGRFTAQYSDLITRTNTFILIRTAVADPLILPLFTNEMTNDRD